MGVWPPTIFWSATDTTIGFLATEVSRVWPRLKGVGLSYPPPLFCSVRYSGIEYCPFTIMKIEVFSWFFLEGQRQGKKMPKACSDRSQKNSRCRSSARHGRLPRGSKRLASAQAGQSNNTKKHSTTQKHFSNSAYTWENTHKIFRIHTPYYLITF